MKLQKKRTWNMLVFLFAAVFYCYVAYHVPYTGDDWDWGLEIGLQHLLTADINSRYAGNFFAVIMTRSKLLQTLIMGAAYLLLPSLMTRIVTKGKSRQDPLFSLIVFIAANCLLLSMDAQIWKQTYGWVSGFANYGISAVLVLIYLYLVQPLFTEERPQEETLSAKALLYVLLGLVMQLFIENLAIAMVLLSAAVCLISYCRTKKVGWKYPGLLVGNILGLGIMFSSAIYPMLFATGKTLNNGRELSYDQSGGILKLVQGCVEAFTKELATLIWENNVVICCSISLLLIILWTVKNKREIGRLESALILIDVLSIPYFVIFSHLEYGKYFLLRFGILDLFETVVNVGFFAAVAIQVVLLYRDRKWHMWKLLMLWIGAPLVILPLSAVVIDGLRFYITSNCFLIVFTLFLLTDCISDMSRQTGRLLLAVGISALLSFSLYYFFVYREIGICTDRRTQIIEEAKQTGAKEITLPAYPYTVMDYVWWGEPGEEYRNVYFRAFFGLDQDVEMTFQME